MHLNCSFQAWPHQPRSPRRLTQPVLPAPLRPRSPSCAGVFACFSAAALLSPRRQYLYLGGLLSSVLSTFMLMRVASFFFGGGALLFEAELYGGLAVFSGYVVYDTQVSCLLACLPGTVRAYPLRSLLLPRSAFLSADCWKETKRVPSATSPAAEV